MVICIEMKSNEAAVSRYKACQKVKRNLKWQKRIGAMEKASDLLISLPSPAAIRYMLILKGSAVGWGREC